MKQKSSTQRTFTFDNIPEDIREGLLVKPGPELERLANMSNEELEDMIGDGK